MSYRVWRKRWMPKQGWEQHPKEWPTFEEAAKWASGCKTQDSVLDVAVLPNGYEIDCRGEYAATPSGAAPARLALGTCVVAPVKHGRLGHIVGIGCSVDGASYEVQHGERDTVWYSADCVEQVTGVTYKPPKEPTP